VSHGIKIEILMFELIERKACTTVMIEGETMMVETMI